MKIFSTLVFATAFLAVATACTSLAEQDPNAKLITYAPDGSSLDVLVTSVLEREKSGCLFVESGGQERLLAAFPEGTRALRDRLTIPELGDVAYGDQFTYTGSEITSDAAASRGLTIPTQCPAGTPLWLMLPDTK